MNLTRLLLRLTGFSANLMNELRFKTLAKIAEQDMRDLRAAVLALQALLKPVERS